MEECADIRIFSSEPLPACISIFDQNQEAEIFKFRWRRQSEILIQFKLTLKNYEECFIITNINFIAYIFAVADPHCHDNRHDSLDYASN